MLRKIEMFRTSSRLKSRFFKSFIDSAVSEECSCCKTISNTAPASSGRSFLLATNFSFTKLICTEPPLTLKRNTPSVLSLTGGPIIFKTSARLVLKGSIPFQDAAPTFFANPKHQITETTRIAVTNENRRCCLKFLTRRC